LRVTQSIATRVNADAQPGILFWIMVLPIHVGVSSNRFHGRTIPTVSFDCSTLAIFAGRTFRSGDVDLWLTRLHYPPAQLQNMAVALSADEAARADRFHFVHDRNRFIAARGLLRNIISCYLSCTPEDIHFAYQSTGKPQLGFPASGSEDLRFNLSHSADAAVYAISLGRDIGVDIESICPDVPWAEVAMTFFAPGEIARLHRLPNHLRAAGFFNCWTRKEAYVKARGEGLSLPLNRFEVSLAPDETPALLSSSDPDELGRWRLFDISPGEGFAAALVVEGRPGRIRFFTCNWPEPSAIGNQL
jgi:4'-phosphopantetheinyl transferase